VGGVKEAFVLGEGEVAEVVNTSRDADAHLAFREEMGGKSGSKMDGNGGAKDAAIRGADADGA
jgi:hypothetical protein